MKKIRLLKIDRRKHSNVSDASVYVTRNEFTFMLLKKFKTQAIFFRDLIAAIIQFTDALFRSM